MLKILTLNWNGEDKIEKLYNSILPTLEGLNWKWIIRDNASKDYSVEKIKMFDNKNVFLIEYPHNKDSFAQGVNFLFKESFPESEDIILLLNNDVIFNDTQSIKNMLKLMEIDNVGVVGARLLYSNTNKIQHCGVTFSTQHGLPYHIRAGEISTEQDLLNREFQAVTGAVWMTRAKYFENICKNSDGSKGLDQKYRWGFEDISASLSIKYEMNKKIIYCGQTNIYHEESASLNKNPQHKLFLNNNSQHLLQTWKNRYILDDYLYINNPKYNIIT